MSRRSAITTSTRVIAIVAAAVALVSMPAYAQDVTSLSITPNSVTLQEGAPVKLRAMAVYSDGVTRDVTAEAGWSVSNTGVLQLSATPGVVQGIGVGTGTVTATHSGFNATATYNVLASSAPGVSRAAFVYGVRQQAASGALTSSVQRLGVAADGALTLMPDAGGTAKIQTMKMTSDSRYLVMLQQPVNEQSLITVHRVDAGNGRLTPVPGAMAGFSGWPGSLAVHPTGQFVYASTSFSPNRLRGYRFDEAAGTLIEVLNTDIDVAAVLEMDPAGQYLYAITWFGLKTYRIEPSGALSLVSTTPMSVILNGMSVAVHGSGDFLYVAGNPQTFKPTVLTYRLTRATGEFTAVGDPIEMPIPPSAGNTAAQVMSAGITGNFFYAGSYNDGLRSYAIDNVTGQLHELAVTNPLPLHDVRAITAEPGGQYLFVAAHDRTITAEARIRAYAPGLDGSLTLVGTYAEGPFGFIFYPLVVASKPPAGVTLDALEVLPAGKQITISAPAGTQQFAAIGHYSDGSSAFFTSSATWTTSNPVVGGFNPLPFYNGEFTISGYGATTISAAASGLTTQTTFTVNPVPVTALTITTPNVSLPQGVQAQMRVTASYSDGTSHDVSALATWSVSDAAVLELSATPGVMRGIGVGVATVTASYSGINATATYTVIAPTVGAGVSRAAFLYGVRQQAASGAFTSSVQRLSVAANGALTLLPDAGGTARVHAMKMTRDSRYLFMLQGAVAEQSLITVHRVDAGNGRLTQVSGGFAGFSGWPGSLAVDPTGRFVYASTSISPNRLHGYRFDEATGTLIPVLDIESDVAAVLEMDPAGQYLYAISWFGMKTYRIEPTGSLSLVSTTPMSVILNGMSVVVHGSGDFLYVAGNPQTFKPTVLTYRLTRATGELTAVGDPIEMPIPPSAGNTAAQVMTAGIAGNFFYAGSYNDGLRTYAIDNASGQLYELSVTNPLPLHDVRAIIPEPGGQYLFVAAHDRTITAEARIRAYAPGLDGSLTLAGTYAEGPFGFIFYPLAVASKPPAGVTLDTLQISPADRQIDISAPAGTQQFSAAGHYSDGSTAFFTSSATWSTSNASVGSFNPLPFYNGEFTIGGYGATTITATVNGFTGTTTFTVNPVAVTGLAITTPNVSLPQGVPAQLRVTASYSDGTAHDVSALATWSVSDTAVLELGVAPGAMRGIGVGVATVTASYSGFSSTATYTVIAPTVGAGVSRAAFVYAVRQQAESGAVTSSVQRLGVAADGALTLLPDAGGTAKIHTMKMTRDSRYVFMLQQPADGQSLITVHRVDAGNGRLTPVSGAFAGFSGWPGSLAVDPAGRFVYASTSISQNRLHGYRFDEVAGTLIPLLDIEIDVAAVLEMDPAGQYLYAATWFGLRTFRIEPTGSLSLVSTTPMSVILNGMSVAVHGSGDFLYVAGNPQTFQPTVLTYRLTRATGEFTEVGDPVLLPIPASAGNTAAQVMTVGIAGNFLYAGSYNDGLRSYAIDNDSGQLYEIAVTNPLPLHDVRAIIAEPGGQYLFVAAQDRTITGEARIRAYAPGLDGALTPVGSYAEGPFGFIFYPIVVANRPAAGVTLSTLEISPANKQVIASSPAGTQQFSAIGRYSDGSSAFFTASAIWTTSNPVVGSFNPLAFYNGEFTISGYGTTTITAMINGMTATTTFSVANVALSLGNLHHVYDGTPKAAGVAGLPAGITGLEVLYNGAVQPPTEAGSYNVVATVNNPFYFAAAATGTLIIDRAPSETAVDCSSGPFIYNGLPQTPCSATTTGAGLQQSAAVDYANNIDPGIATASAGFAGDANHLPSSDSTTFAIGKAASTTVLTCGATPLTYSGAPQTPCSATVTGVGFAQPLVVDYANNVDAGIATATAGFAGDANHLPSSDSNTFAIGKANPTINVAGYDVAFDGAAHTATGTGTGVLNEPLSGLNLVATTHTAPGVYADVWTFTDTTGNYNSITGTVTNTIRESSIGLSLIGFHQPVNMAALNTVKGGSTVPLKFNIYEGATERKDVAAIKSFEVMAGTCSGVATEAVAFVTTGATSLRYDATTGQFIQNWKTPATSGVCYQVTVTAVDGTTLTALFRTK